MNKTRITSCEKKAPSLPNVRQSFQLIYYRSEEGLGWQGRIIHLLSQEKHTFPDDNLVALSTFINQFLSNQREPVNPNGGRADLKKEDLR